MADAFTTFQFTTPTYKPALFRRQQWRQRRVMDEINRLKYDNDYAFRCVNGDQKALDRLLKLHEKLIPGYRWYAFKRRISTAFLNAVYPYFQERL